MKTLIHNDQEFYLNAFSIGTLYELHFIDMELGGEKIEETITSFNSLFSKSAPQYKYRFIAFKEKEKRDHLFLGREDLKDISSVYTQRFFLSIEKDFSALSLFKEKVFGKSEGEERVRVFLKNLNLDFLKETFSFKESSLKNLPEEFHSFEPKRIYKKILEKEDTFLGVLKLSKLKEKPIYKHTLSHVFDSLPAHTGIVTEITPKSRAYSRSKSQREALKKQSSFKLSNSMDSEEISNLSAQIEREDLKLCKLESTVFIKKKRIMEEAFISTLNKVSRLFSELGEYEVEDLGIYASLKSAQILGRSDWHHLEVSNKVFPYIPCFTFGEEDPYHKVHNEHSLILKRENDTLTGVDPLNEDYTSYNNLIIGKTGRGKSLFFGLILKNFIKRKDSLIQVLDIGGSYKNLVENLGGVVRSFDLTKPSGINPFKYVSSEEIGDETKVEILSSFLENLSLEENETSFKKSEKSDLEKELLIFLKYHKTQKQHDETLEVTLDDFLSFSKNLPRKQTLLRFSKKGLYHNMFSPIEKTKKEKEAPFLEYFNFESLMKSNDKSFVTAGVSSVISSFNLNIFTQKHKKKILAVDECPEFIKENYEFFKFSSSNIRKFGGCMFVLAQTLEKICPNKDTSFVSQFDNHFLFSEDKDEEFFKKTLSLSDEGYERIKNFQTVKGIGGYSKLLFKDRFGERALKVEVTEEEYLTLTTNDEDKKRIDQAVEFLSYLTRSEVLRVLSQAGVF